MDYNQHLQDTIDLVRELVGNEYFYFDTVLYVKLTPHTDPARIWGVCVSPDGVLYWMDANQQWTAIDPVQHREATKEESFLIASVYQRAKFIKTKYARSA